MILGLNGNKEVGKDTAYGFIEEWAEENKVKVKREAFADRLKLSACRIFYDDGGLPEAIHWADALKNAGSIEVKILVRRKVVQKKTLTGREFLQRYGTEAHRQIFGTDFWLRPIEDAYKADPSTLMVVTDVRFDNEADLIHKLGGEVWEIKRPGFSGDGHASEQPLKPESLDRVIINDHGLDRFKTRVLLQIERASL